MNSVHRRWQIWIDTGGTFTDCIATNLYGEILRVKVLSSGSLRGTVNKQLTAQKVQVQLHWAIKTDIFKGYEFKVLDSGFTAKIVAIDFEENSIQLDREILFDKATDFEITAFEEAPILAARLITQTALHDRLPPIDMRLGSTKGTNALLENKGTKFTLLITKGFKDLVAIGTQQRPHLFQLNIPNPKLLFSNVIEVDERLDANGNPIVDLGDDELNGIVKQLKIQKTKVVAISLMHAYLNPQHELLLKERLQKEGILFISVSHELSPTIKILPRTQTSLVNAYLSPIIHDYINQINSPKIQKDLHLRIMTSAGGLVDAQFFHPKDSLLSGPAGGVVGAVHIAKSLGVSKLLSLDMGGTSTDCARYDNQLDYQFLTTIGETKLLSPALFIETVAAGGGSICSFDGYKLTVGPESAGAVPGPACYGAGGPLTISDINLLLGKMDVSNFAIPLRIERSKVALKELQKKINKKTNKEYTALELLQGFEKIANEKMAEAIRKISIAKGFSTEGYSLLVFGGAGGLHGCQIAELLNIKSLILPYDGGLLSAYGIGHAQIERFVEQQVLQELQDCQKGFDERIQQLSEKAIKALVKEGIGAPDILIKKQLLYLRFKGQDSTLEINYTKWDNIIKDFEIKYQSLFGHWPSKGIVELESIKIIAAAQEKENTTIEDIAPLRKVKSKKTLYTIYDPDKKIDSYNWDELTEGDFFDGPAVLLNNNSTAYISAGWQLTISHHKNAVVHYLGTEKREDDDMKEAIELELFTNRFSAIANEMGAQLQRTAFSVNIKERLDFSCAILDVDKMLLVNAPHIPVHLGSLGICARLATEKLSLSRGDVIITNHPKYGGSHLPDVTMMSAVFTDDGRLIAYVINRAHHAEIGGKRPGSMPPDASSLVEEGVVIEPMYLVREGIVQWQAIEEKLTTARYPTRAIQENLADINAALASLRLGVEQLQKMERQFGLDKLHYYMRLLKMTAKDALNEAIQSIRGKNFSAIESLDDGHQIKVNIQIGTPKITIDFTGTSPRHPYNLNANISIVYSAVIYVLRLLCKKDIPLNEGLMEQVNIILPKSFLHPVFDDDPAICPAVVGGNTEVSQRLVDTLLKAFEMAACSQGTMNNFLFGNDIFGYYETIGGGTGAGKNFNGRSAVHQHMTNTKITDPEEMELRYPVRLQEFAIRKNSGGKGKWTGGDGIIRTVEFLESIEMTIITQHRNIAPYGLNGGGNGKKGKQYVIKKNGDLYTLNGVDSISLEAGDRVVIKTPGGGGYGKIDN